MFKKLILSIILLFSYYCTGNAQSGSQTLTYSSSLVTFNPTTYLSGTVTLTGNLQTFAITNGTVSGQSYLMTFCQDSVGFRIINSGPSNFGGTLSLYPASGACTNFNIIWLNNIWRLTKKSLATGISQVPTSGTTINHLVSYTDSNGTMHDSGLLLNTICTTGTGCAASGFANITAGTAILSSLVATMGSFNDGTQGLILKAYTGAGGYGAIYPYGVTPSNTNYYFVASPNTTNINSPTIINFDIAGNGIGTLDGSGFNGAIGRTSPNTGTFTTLTIGNGFTGIKTMGLCVVTISSGIITNVTGC